jgi:hypothetical protein
MKVVVANATNVVSLVIRSYTVSQQMRIFDIVISLLQLASYLRLLHCYAVAARSLGADCMRTVLALLYSVPSFVRPSVGLSVYRCVVLRRSITQALRMNVASSAPGKDF